MLNKNGWGIKVAIIFICVFMFCLLFAVFLATSNVNKLNEVHEEQEYVDSDNSFDSSEYYENLETDVYEATKEYVSDNPKIKDEDYFKLNIDTLITTGYLSSFEDEYGNSCSGYVEISNDNGEHYDVYIICENYQTTGYDERKAF